MRKRIKIIIAEDFPMFREGIRLMLEKEEFIDITGEANNGEELLSIIRETPPDLVITDIEMPLMNGVKATRQIKQEFPEVRVIALTMFGDEHLIIEMLEAGANGYLLKNTKKAELLEAVETVMNGRTYFCNQTSMKLSIMIARSKIAGQPEEVRLSDKEKEIIQLICEQYASKEIADKTQLTHRTVEKYRDHIMQKTGSKNMAGIVIFAIREGLYKV